MLLTVVFLVLFFKVVYFIPFKPIEKLSYLFPFSYLIKLLDRHMLRKVFIWNNLLQGVHCAKNTKNVLKIAQFQYIFST